MFKVNQSVVHLSHGVGKISGIESREFSPGKVTKFYILTIMDGGAPKKVFVPFDSAKDRLRAIIKDKDVLKVYELIQSDASYVEGQTWNMRYREYMELLHTGDVFNIAKVFKQLITVCNNKDLSFGERKLLEQAKTLLVNELSLATNKSTEEIETKLEELTKVYHSA
jgi:CarD family transcriptional regulator